MIRLTNTLTREKEEFKPLTPGQIGMYSCGPTVYHYVHIGNLRSFLLSDLTRRMFEYNGYAVKQVMNITDIGEPNAAGEDKVEQAAKVAGKTTQEIASFYTEAFLADLAALNIKTESTLFPKATEHITEQIEIIKSLEAKGYTYQIADGVYFDTSRFAPYGELAHLDIEGLKAGARVEVNQEKKNPADFALWKFSASSEKRQQEWESPWGIGFPGWHIECSAMSMKYLGKHFDIHTGGVDLTFPHHTNERAQSEAATGKTFTNIWLHGEFVNIASEKMSKSIGNIYRLTDIEEKGISPLAYRYWLLTAHYRSIVNFTWEALEGAETALERLQNAILEHKAEGGSIKQEYKNRFQEMISDDLNMPQALALLWSLIKDTDISPADKYATVVDFDKVLGLNLDAIEIEIPAEIQKLATDRETARQSKNYTAADTIRQQIETAGYTVKDTEQGPRITQK